MYEKWVEAIGKENMAPCSHAFISTEHFEDRFVNRIGNGRATLAKGGIPSLKLTSKRFKVTISFLFPISI